jgi:hypothetical protein
LVASELQSVSPRTPLRWGPILVAALFIKISASLLDFLVAFAYELFGGEMNPDAFSAFKKQNIWIDPVNAGLLFFLFAWWIAKAARGRQILHGTLVGVTALLINVAFGARFENWPDFLLEAGVPIGASWLGGWVAARRVGLPTSLGLSEAPIEVPGTYPGADDNVK